MTGNKLLHSDSKYSHLTHPHHYHCWVVSELRLFSVWTFWTLSLQKKQMCEVVTLSDDCLLFRCPSSRAMVLHTRTLNAKHDKIKCLLWHLQVLIRVKLSVKQKPFIYLWHGHRLVEQALLHIFSWRRNKLEKLQYVSVTNPNRIKSVSSLLLVSSFYRSTQRTCCQKALYKVTNTVILSFRW